MGLFNTEMNYNSEKVQEALSLIKQTNYYITAAKVGINEDINMITNATGYDLVEKEGGSISSGYGEKIGSKCQGDINDIISTINEKVSLVEAYSNAEGLDKAIIFTKTKLSNIADFFQDIASDIAETGADIVEHGVSILAPEIKKMQETGAAICKKIASLSEIIFGKKSSKKSDDEATKIESQNTLTEEEKNASNIFSSILANQNTATKNINTNNIKENSRIGNAIQKYASEVNNAEYATVSENLFTTTTTDYINGQPVKVTHIIINDPSQINGAPANGAYGNGKEYSTSAASRLNSSILINGSHFLGDGTEDLSGANNVVIVNGQIKKDGVSGGNELLLDSAGNIFNASGKSAQELVNNGVKYSFACHSTQVIVNGDTSPSYLEDRDYKRNVIGQAGPGEYYIVTDTTYENTLSNTAEYLKGKGVYNAYSLDQGGSVSLVRDDTVINNPSDSGPDGQRQVGDFLFFTA